MKTNQPKFYWKKHYQRNGRTHWALCDTQTDSQGPPSRVSSFEMVLLDSTSTDIPSRDLPKLIIELLNNHFAESK